MNVEVCFGGLYTMAALVGWGCGFVLFRTFLPKSRYDGGEHFLLPIVIGAFWPLAAVIATIAVPICALSSGDD